MLAFPFTVKMYGVELEIPAGAQEVANFLEATDVLYDIDDFESILEVPFYPDRIWIDCIEQHFDSAVPVTVEELNEMYFILARWNNSDALDAGLSYFGGDRLMAYEESDFVFYPENELEDFGIVLAYTLCNIPWELGDYIDYESFASDYMEQVDGAVTEYGTIIMC